MGVNNTNRRGGTGGGEFIFTQDIPVNLNNGGKIGKYPSGTSIPSTGKNPQQVWLDVANEYLTPSFASFLMRDASGALTQPLAVEVGTILTGNRVFIWAINNSVNVEDSSLGGSHVNTLRIKDITNNLILASGLSKNSPATVAIGSISKDTLASHAFQVEATNTLGTIFPSSQFIIQWQFKRFIGTSNNAVLTEAEIKALALNTIGNTKNGTYALAAGGYKYLCWPDSYGSPTASTGIRDTATGFPVAMADSSDNAFFSNIQNGWPYGLVSVTNALGVTTNYRVYRSKNILGGSINIQIS